MDRFLNVALHGLLCQNETLGLPLDDDVCIVDYVNATEEDPCNPMK